mmetsp:Transcript_6924/g.20243  ORF Transcript_6924/g.20243 Transcript_6924/m.20243 type:complete len:96 (-) Transcript_6924:269-556(-)
MCAQDSHCHKFEMGDEGTDARMIIPTLTSWSSLQTTDRPQATKGSRKDLQTMQRSAALQWQQTPSRSSFRAVHAPRMSEPTETESSSTISCAVIA